jgi:uncharacterized LabA/DUF88 family protein
MKTEKVNIGREVLMESENSRLEMIRSALFLDFDNIYIRLEQQYNIAVANSFAISPDHWGAWLEQNAEITCEDGRPRRRKILVRKCFMNPEKFSKFRRNFTQASFEVIDCPPLTEQGKTSTDMHMVIDVLDALTYPVRIDEFVILSGDADFTPLLLRLRRHDRYTTIFSVGPASGIYKASCDNIIPEDEFISKALGREREEQLGKARSSRAEASHLSNAPASSAKKSNLLSQPVRPTDPSATPVADKTAGQSKPFKPDNKPSPKSTLPKLRYLTSKIHETTGIPNLSRDQLSALFDALAEEINSNGTDKDKTAQAVQDRCTAQKQAVLQKHVKYVMKACQEMDHWFIKGKESTEAIAQSYLMHIQKCCQAKHLQLSEIELSLLHRWITGNDIG